MRENVTDNNFEIVDFKIDHVTSVWCILIMQTFEVVCPSAPDTTTLRDHAVGLAVALAVVALADFALRQLSAALAENDAARWWVQLVRLTNARVVCSR